MHRMVWVAASVIAGCGGGGGQSSEATGRAAEPAVVGNAATIDAAPAPLAGCDVVIEERLDAEVFRGSPMTPSYAAALEAQKDGGRRWMGYDHGVKYLECTYRLR